MHTIMKHKTKVRDKQQGNPFKSHAGCYGISSRASHVAYSDKP